MKIWAHIWNQRPPFSMCTNFQPNLTTLIFRRAGFEPATSSTCQRPYLLRYGCSTKSELIFGISDLDLVCVPIFSQIGRHWYFAGRASNRLPRAPVNALTDCAIAQIKNLSSYSDPAPSNYPMYQFSAKSKHFDVLTKFWIFFPIFQFWQSR